jgi:hypothetical protein
MPQVWHLHSAHQRSIFCRAVLRECSTQNRQQNRANPVTEKVVTTAREKAKNPIFMIVPPDGMELRPVTKLPGKMAC